MSNINIRRAVENMRQNTTVYTPIVEMVVNAIQAIDEIGRNDGRVQIRALRSHQLSLDGALAEIIGFEIEDNGVGFTEAHRESFDTLYTDQKIREGGKGFGRFTALRYFDDVHFRSVHRDGRELMVREFSMGRDQEIIVSEQVGISSETDTGTVVTLTALKANRHFEKRLSTIAGNIVERLLPYFIAQDYECPEITISEEDGTDPIRLNDFVSNELSSSIREVDDACKSFTVSRTDSEEEFLTRVFKIYSPGNQKSRIGLVAHKREVSGSLIDKYVPEFVDEFVELDSRDAGGVARNYIIKVYVFGNYLDSSVSLERSGFEFSMERGLFYDIGQAQIEQCAATIARDAMGADVRSRQQMKKELVQSYVDDRAPWNKSILAETDLSGLPLRPSEGEIDSFLHHKKFEREVAIRRDVEIVLENTDWQDNQRDVAEIVSRISRSGSDELTHYIAFRRMILDLFRKSLETDESGAYSSEGKVHDIIFPRRQDSDSTSLDDHNLWIIDERLNFTKYVTSDNPLYGGNSERPDLLVYDKRVMFRGDNEDSNPVTIFEFKKPQRDDFVNPSSKEDPVQQIVRYVNDIRDGKFKTREGRIIRVKDNTPFYGYVVCDLTKKVETWLEREKNFTPMPDRQGWFHWMDNINLYLEVVSWDKLLGDSTKRNQIFFRKLGI